MSSTHNSSSNEASILHSWEQNADAWSQTVRDGHIESRRLVTDHAIIEAVLDGHPGSVMDLGCGEGWLVRALADHDIQVLGVDAIPELIARASEAGGEFHVMSYDDIITGRWQRRVDTVVCNFALLGKDSVEQLVAALPSLLTEGGRFIVQTVHPLVASREQTYEDGWRQESWSGFGRAFPATAPWYFRTLSSWVALFASAGWHLCEVREPLHPATGQPASVIFILQRR
jgi:2-polyprenyl-3-methyl-5-hydroxy-6-metoxy-1,4-benzoquinol methylase